jgi:hypothetical protein
LPLQPVRRGGYLQRRCFNDENTLHRLNNFFIVLLYSIFFHLMSNSYIKSTLQ